MNDINENDATKRIAEAIKATIQRALALSEARMRDELVAEIDRRFAALEARHRA